MDHLNQSVAPTLGLSDFKLKGRLGKYVPNSDLIQRLVEKNSMYVQNTLISLDPQYLIDPFSTTTNFYLTHCFQWFGLDPAFQQQFNIMKKTCGPIRSGPQYEVTCITIVLNKVKGCATQHFPRHSCFLSRNYPNSN